MDSGTGDYAGLPTGQLIITLSKPFFANVLLEHGGIPHTLFLFTWIFLLALTFRDLGLGWAWTSDFKSGFVNMVKQI